MASRIKFRPLFVLLMAVLLAALIAGCGESSQSAAAPSSTLTIYSSGDVNVQNLWNHTLIPQFKKVHPEINLKLIFAEHGVSDQSILARINAAVNANKDPGIDLIDSGPVEQAADAHLLAPMTAKDVPNMAHIDPSLIQQVHSFGVPYRASSVVLAYNSKTVANPPTTLKDLLAWIKAHPGKFTYNTPNSGGSGHAFVEAILNSHLSADSQKKFVASYDPAMESQWDAGMKELKSLSPSVYRQGFYPNGNVAVLQLLANGSIDVAPVWSDMALSYLAEHQLPDSVKLIQLDPPFSGGPAFLGIPRTTQHLAQVYTLVNWILSADVQSTIIDAINGYPGVQWSYVSQQVRDKYASIARSYGTGFSTKFGADVNKQWQTEVAGQ
ncbi:extracellular solute-binding protein [Ktedonosporobacter rubrisoli]|nr:extracellular solute-binding protein [Ktedonosporobacter rubrisoli]